MKRWSAIAPVIIAGLAAAFFYGVSYHDAHRGTGARHIFSLVSDRPITDQEMLDWSKQVLISDERFSPDLALSKFGDGSYISHGIDPNLSTVCWRNSKTFREWYVRFERLPGKVEGVSYPGK